MEREVIVRSEVSQTHEEKYKSFLSPGECECESIRAAVVGLKRICKGKMGQYGGWEAERALREGIKHI